ncbi:MAG: DNA-processing protein DprA [Treponema sp.]|jgi:DNA processing protein|nr:DNA-processing protein DprA [Treponema sp.]
MDDHGLLGLIISRLPGLSYQEKTVLCESFDSESDLIGKTQSDIESIVNRKLKSFWNIDKILRLAQKDAQAAQLRGINWVSWRSTAYPPLLREMYDPPVVLFYKGRLPNPQAPLVAVVGTRKPSPLAAAQAFDIAKGLGRSGISVVSGLAIGIDAMAHRGNLEGGAPTFAVLGSGVDEVYPSSNRALARRILETGGALLSEYPPGTAPRKWTFPARNRIVSGMARGVLIVEAPQKSGALITARFALDQNRDLWVASTGAAGGENGQAARFDRSDRFYRRGTAALVADGAGTVYSASDILEAWIVETPIPEQTARGLAFSLARTLGIEIPIHEERTWQ